MVDHSSLIRTGCGQSSRGKWRPGEWDALREYLTSYFQSYRVDKDRSGNISGDELQQALSNGMLTFAAAIFENKLHWNYISPTLFRVMDSFQPGNSSFDDR